MQNFSCLEWRLRMKLSLFIIQPSILKESGSVISSLVVKIEKKEVGSINSEQLYDYFVEVLHLLSDLCYEGYSNAVNELQRFYDFETLIEIMNSEDITYDIKDATCHLFTTVWVQVQDHTKLKVDQFIVEWDKLKDNYSFVPLDVEILFKYKPIKYYLSQTINYHFIYIDLSQKEAVHQLSYLNSIIRLSMKMIEAGFYTELKEINALVKGVIKVLAQSFTYNDGGMTASNNDDLTKTLMNMNLRNEEASAYDSNIAIVQLRDCRISICNFLDFINKLQIMLKHNTAMFRLKNLILTNGPAPGVTDRHPSDYLYFQDKRIREQDILNKVGFLVNNMTKEEGFIKIGHDQQSTMQLVTLLLSMSLDNNLVMKEQAIKVLIFLFSNCLRVTESMTEVIAIDQVATTYYMDINNLRKDISTLLITYNSSVERSISDLFDKAEGNSTSPSAY
jgi:hypothetical protein